MKRRELLVGLAAIAASPSLALANQRLHFANGIVTGAGFDWDQGGGDPLRAHLRRDHFRGALQIESLRFSRETQAQMRAALAGPPAERISLTMYQGQRLQGAVMVSGNGWLAFDPRINTYRWSNRRFGADVWFVTTSQGRFQVIVPEVCSNLIFVPRGQALPCVCEPGVDACASAL